MRLLPATQCLGTHNDIETDAIMIIIFIIIIMTSKGFSPLWQSTEWKRRTRDLPRRQSSCDLKWDLPGSPRYEIAVHYMAATCMRQHWETMGVEHPGHVSTFLDNRYMEPIPEALGADKRAHNSIFDSFILGDTGREEAVLLLEQWCDARWVEKYIHAPLHKHANASWCQ